MSTILKRIVVVCAALLLLYVTGSTLYQLTNDLTIGLLGGALALVIIIDAHIRQVARDYTARIASGKV